MIWLSAIVLRVAVVLFVVVVVIFIVVVHFDIQKVKTNTNLV